MTRIIIAGSRDFNDYYMVCMAMLNNPWFTTVKDVEIVSGGCRGADTLGERFARENNIKLTIFYADWDRYGKSAGPIRNEQMAKYASEANHGILIAFPLGESRGTRNMIEVAKRYGLETHVYEEIT